MPHMNDINLPLGLKLDIDDELIFAVLSCYQKRAIPTSGTTNSQTPFSTASGIESTTIASSMTTNVNHSQTYLMHQPLPSQQQQMQFSTTAVNVTPSTPQTPLVNSFLQHCTLAHNNTPVESHR